MQNRKGVLGKDALSFGYENKRFKIEKLKTLVNRAYLLLLNFKFCKKLKK